MTKEEEAAARKKELAEAMADGFDLFRTREVERVAKEEASKSEEEKKAKKDDDSTEPTFIERLLSGKW